MTKLSHKTGIRRRGSSNPPCPRLSHDNGGMPEQGSRGILHRQGVGGTAGGSGATCMNRAYLSHRGTATFHHLAYEVLKRQFWHSTLSSCPE